MCGLLSSCIDLSGEAPVLDRSLLKKPTADLYRVQTDDTLYSIAWSYQLDYRELLALNQLKPPYAIHVGQWLRVRPNVTSLSRPPVHPVTRNLGHIFTGHWHWPAKGRVIHTFSAKPFGNKGISIAGRLGEPVVAAVAGTVVYSGAGVRGYGNIIIIKHDQNYLSAYAFNQRNLVKEGSRVIAGEKVAEMGQNNSGRVLLYFEIRQNGKPVNPMLYLQK